MTSFLAVTIGAVIGVGLILLTSGVNRVLKRLRAHSRLIVTKTILGSEGPSISVSSVEGARMPSTTPLPLPGDRHPRLSYGHHPDMGGYSFSSTTGGWTHGREMADGGKLLVSGYGREPTQAQIDLWKEIDLRLPELAIVAMAAVTEPPVTPRRVKFQRSALKMYRVEVQDDGTFSLYLVTPVGKEIGMEPVVTFDRWRATECDWVT